VRAVVQRVAKAHVEVEGELVARIERGLLVLLGVERADTEREADLLAEKIAKLRIFPSDAKPIDRSVVEIGGAALVVSQFTLASDVTGGNRPSFLEAAPPDVGERLYLRFADVLGRRGVPTRTGRFGAHMRVALVNDGPVTLVLSCPAGGDVGN
jgi:D-aminoacyl-tRNA deacylase